MGRIARFKVTGSGYGNDFNGKNSATIEIDRNTDIVTVRPCRMHKTYISTLGTMARSVIFKAIQAELAEKKKIKKQRRLIKRGKI